MAVKVVTDSTSYIPEPIRDELGISTVSLSVNFGTETYHEEKLDYSTFYEMMAGSREVPTSSQPSLDELYRVFASHVASGDTVVGVFISSDMSGTYQTALTASRKVMEAYPDAVIRIVDSRSNCMELGFAVLTAARLAKAGALLEEILAETQQVIDTSRFLFVPETLEYLRKGGRIGGAAALLGSILQIKPILTVLDGKTAVFGKVRSKARAVETIMNTFLADVRQRGLGGVVVHHINAEAEGRAIALRIEKALELEVPVYPIGPVIGLHVGPGTVGLVYNTLKS